MDIGDWSIRNWRPLAGLTTALFVALGALAGYFSTYDSSLPALGGPNALLYDLTLKMAQPWRRHLPTAPVVLVAIDDASLASPELAALPRALFQPVWARLIDGLLAAGARRVAFDVVFAYAGADFQIGAFTLPGYDRSLIDSLAAGRERIVLARFPSVAPAPPFLAAMGAARVGVLDLQVESDGRVRSTAPIVRLPDGRVALGFAALGAGWGVREAASVQRLLLTPSAPLADTATYSLGTLLACLSSTAGIDEVRKAVEGRIVVIGTTVLGEDEHRGPARFLGAAVGPSPGDRCAPRTGLVERRHGDQVPGALLQIAAIQSAASNRPVLLAPAWLRLGAGAWLAFLFALMAFRDDSALALGERDISPGSVILVQLARSVAFGLVGPALVGCLLSASALVLADLWLPMGYPVLATILAFGTILGFRSVRHRAFFRRLYRTVGRYLPPERLVTLARSSFSDPLEGQEREVSILLADLVGFTSFSNRPDLTASEIVRVANRYFTLMQAAIDRHDGCSDKFLGDAVLAFWNGLSDEPEHAVKALATAQDIIEAVSAAEESDNSRLAARAVVCSGRVYVGDIGAKQRSNFTIIGPAVNETFRIEKVADVYGLPLLLAASTAEMIMGSTSGAASVLGSNVLLRIDDLELKGFAGARSVYALVPRDDPGLAAFEAGRKALDRHMVGEGLAHLAAVERGMLRQAAKVVSAATNRPREALSVSGPRPHRGQPLRGRGRISPRIFRATSGNLESGAALAYGIGAPSVANAVERRSSRRGEFMAQPLSQPQPQPQPQKAFPVGWDQFHRDARALAWRLAGAGPFQAIVCVTRGGLVPAAIVARELGIRLIETVCVASYNHIQQGELKVLKDVAGSIVGIGGGRGKGVLIVDDLVDTGKTAKVVREILPEAHFATVYAKPMGRPMVDTFITEVSQDTWIYFPWDTGLAFVPPIRDGEL